MQEVGGKNFEECINQVPAFLNHVAASMLEMGYSTGRAYLDLEFDLPESYNVCFIFFFRIKLTILFRIMMEFFSFFLKKKHCIICLYLFLQSIFRKALKIFNLFEKFQVSIQYLKMFPFI